MNDRADVDENQEEFVQELEVAEEVDLESEEVETESEEVVVSIGEE